MKGIMNLLIFVMISVALLLIVYGLYTFAQYVYGNFIGLEARDQAMVLLLAVTVLLAAWILGRKSPSRSSISDGGVITNSKIQLYLRLLNSLDGNMSHNFIATLSELRNDLILLADELVLEKLNKLESLLSGLDNSSAAVQAQRTQLIKAMRRDLGQDAGLWIQAVENFQARKVADKTAMHHPA